MPGYASGLAWLCGHHPSSSHGPFQAYPVPSRRASCFGKQPKLSPKQQAELRRMHASGDYTITDLTELFSVSRPTVYRTLQRNGGS
ncbi:DNA invertase Pin-like site-specific DNA recombinase [Saccharopolyspora lacisalsi]|uniref:DNA invertase Pin-like site-specific DNA recombinase n=1 Tax=Halosaccharopolyspora lacisalsi TaxID=1000566 RepID=A0A839DV59_9PSEU|nr:helix-turn-helix domain-containing protein [Halosaccharopolyspora lacisalsi]MBA8824800.1 DNA invertase Pin-like site-specific DNA recombinase [Halosaccharopolyspora lacisalsi]